MSQATAWGVFRDGDAPKTPDQIKERDGEMLDATLSCHLGPTPPAYAVDGTIWKSDATGAVMQFDGTDWRTLHSPSVHSELTLAAGTVTPLFAGLIPVDTEADAATDDLETIDATNVIDGETVILKAADNARTVVVIDGADNIACGSDLSLDNILDRITLQWDAASSTWVLLSFADNGA